MSKERITNESEPIDVSNLGVLSNSLREREAASTALYGRAEGVLDQAGQETTVDGVASFVTPQYCEVILDEKPLYARLGRYIKPEGVQPDLPSIIFCADSNFDNIQTSNGYFSALTFRGGILEGAHLIAGGGTLDDPVSDHPEHIALAKKIIDTVSSSYSDARNADKQAREKQQRAAERKAADDAAAREKEAQQLTEARAQRRRNRTESLKKTSIVIGTAATIGSLLWYNSIHAAFTGDKIDAKLGPVPMPAPIEWIVDLNNSSDHTAQSFHKPEGSLPITVGMNATDIPLLTGYNTNDAPDASFNHALSGYGGDVSKPGLYNSDFDSNYHYKRDTATQTNVDGSASFGTDGDNCYAINGDFVDGKTTIFSQTYGINNMVTFSVPDIHTLKVCKKSSAPKNFKGSIFVYQKP